MSGLTPDQALRKIDEQASQLKDMVNSYWELIGLTEEERDEYIIYCARMFRMHRRAKLHQLRPIFRQLLLDTAIEKTHD